RRHPPAPAAKRMQLSGMKTAPDDDASTLFYQPTDTTKRPRALRRFTVVRYGPRVSVPRRDEEPVVMDVEAGLLQHRRQLGLSGPGRRVMGHMADKLERDRAIPKFHCGGERVQTSREQQHSPGHGQTGGLRVVHAAEGL